MHMLYRGNLIGMMLIKLGIRCVFVTFIDPVQDFITLRELSIWLGRV